MKLLNRCDSYLIWKSPAGETDGGGFILYILADRYVSTVIGLNRYVSTRQEINVLQDQFHFFVNKNDWQYHAIQ